MMRPDFIGEKSLYLNPTNVELSTAEIALVDTSFDNAVVSPYAYTATIREDYDTANFATNSAGSDLVFNNRLAVGLFLTPEVERGNFLFQVNGKACFAGSGTSILGGGSFFFGRKATNNTVVSSKAAASNQLAQYMLLPSNSANINVGTGLFINDSIETEVWSLWLAAGFVYCFGYMLFNTSAATNLTLRGMVSLSMRKYNSELSVFRPSR